MFYGSKCWAITYKINFTDKRMLRWMSAGIIKNMIRNENIIDNLGVDKIEKIALGGVLTCRRSKQDVERRSDSVQTTTKKRKRETK